MSNENENVDTDIKNLRGYLKDYVKEVGDKPFKLISDKPLNESKNRLLYLYLHFIGLTCLNNNWDGGSSRQMKLGPEETGNENKPQEVKPQEVKPQEVKPQEVKPQEVKPQEVKPQEVKPPAVKPQEGVKSQEAKPQTVKPKEGEKKQLRTLPLPSLASCRIIDMLEICQQYPGDSIDIDDDAEKISPTEFMTMRRRFEYKKESITWETIFLNLKDHKYIKIPIDDLDATIADEEIDEDISDKLKSIMSDVKYDESVHLIKKPHDLPIKVYPNYEVAGMDARMDAAAAEAAAAAAKPKERKPEAKEVVPEAEAVATPKVDAVTDIFPHVKLEVKTQSFISNSEYANHLGIEPSTFKIGDASLYKDMVEEHKLKDSDVLYKLAVEITKCLEGRNIIILIIDENEKYTLDTSILFYLLR